MRSRCCEENAADCKKKSARCREERCGGERRNVARCKSKRKGGDERRNANRRTENDKKDRCDQNYCSHAPLNSCERPSKRKRKCDSNTDAAGKMKSDPVPRLMRRRCCRCCKHKQNDRKCHHKKKIFRDRCREKQPSEIGWMSHLSQEGDRDGGTACCSDCRHDD